MNTSKRHRVRRASFTDGGAVAPTTMAVDARPTAGETRPSFVLSGRGYSWTVQQNNPDTTAPVIVLGGDKTGGAPRT